IATRTPFQLDIERDRGQLYQLTANDTVRNSYTLKMINMSQEPHIYVLKMEGLEHYKMDGLTEYTLRVNELKEVIVDLEIDPEKAKLPSSKTDIEFVVYDKDTGEEIAREESRFIAPRG
ncbi:MAG: cytochrome c oxidase accessory protein CcoG, partial [Thalassolituus oleivorans]